MVVAPAMPPGSAFKVYLRDSSEAIEVVTPAKSEAEKVPLGFEKRDRIPRTPVKDGDEDPLSTSQLDSVISTPLADKDKQNPFESFNMPEAPIQRIDRKKKPWLCWRRLCIIS